MIPEGVTVSLVLTYPDGRRLNIELERAQATGDLEHPRPGSMYGITGVVAAHGWLDPTGGPQGA